MSQDSKTKISKQNSKIIRQHNLDGTFIKEWSSIREATKTLKINNISMCCNKKLKSSGGFIFKFI